MKLRWAPLGTLLLGLLLLSVGAASWPAAANDGAEVTVPGGHIGDRVTYAGFLRDENDWRFVNHTSMEVQSVERSIDQTWTERDVVRVVWGSLHDHYEVSSLDGPVQVEATGNSGVSLDLGTRQPIHSSVRELYSERGAANSIEWVYPQEYYGPQFESAYAHIFYQIGPVPLWFASQGRTFSPSGSPDLHGLPLLAGEWLLHRPETKVLERDRFVAGPALIEGTLAIALREQGCVQLDVPRTPARDALNYEYYRPGARPAAAGEVRFLNAVVPANAEVCYQVDVWVSEASPYPLRYDELVQVQGGATQEWTDVQVEYVPGEESIPWGQAGAMASRRPQTEFSALPHPTDGTGPRLPHSLDAALRSVTSDPTLRSYQGFRQNHADVRLLGGSFDAAGSACVGSPLGDAKAPQWSLLFGRPNGEYVLVRSALLPSVAVPTNCETPLFTGATFQAEDLPSRSITVAQMLRSLNKFNASAPRVPDHVTWGWGAWCRVGGAVPVDPVKCPPSQLRLFPGDADPVWLSAGRLEYVHCPSCPQGEQSIALDLDMRSGDIESDSELQWRSTLTVHALPVGSPGPAAIAAVPDAPPGLVPVTISAGLILASIVALVVGVLKFLSLAPGYAKLQKPRILENPLRERVNAIIQGHPGIHPELIADALGCSPSTALHHVRVLERNGLVRSHQDGRYRRFFPMQVSPSQQPGLMVLRNERTLGLYRILKENPDARQRQLAAALGISVPATLWHLERLRSARLIDRRRQGREYLYFVTPTA